MPTTLYDEKGLIRRVRTPEGMRRFGLPMGSIIVRDLMVPNIPRKVPKAGKKRVAKRSPALKRPSQARIPISIVSGGDTSADVARPRNPDDMGASDRIDYLRDHPIVGRVASKVIDHDWDVGEMGPVTLFAGGKGTFSIGSRIMPYKYRTEINALKDGLAFRKEVNPDSADNIDDIYRLPSKTCDSIDHTKFAVLSHKATAAQYKAWIKQFEAKQRALEEMWIDFNRRQNEKVDVRQLPRPEGFQPIWEYHWGLFGRDFQHEPDEEFPNPPVIDPERFARDPAYRREAAIYDAMRLGISFKSNVRGKEFPTDILEVVNMSHRMMSMAYPGFTLLQREYEYGVSPDASSRLDRALAWCGPRTYTGPETYIGFSSKNLGQNIVEDGYSSTHYQSGFTGIGTVPFKSAEPEDTIRARLTENNELSPWQISLMRTVLHEMGHTVGFSITGRTKLDAFTDEDRAGWFMEYALPKLEEYGVIKEDFRYLIDIDAADGIGIRYGNAYPATVENMDDGSIDYYDYSAAASQVSGYGGTMLHETFAETWAAHLQNAYTTPFVHEFGEVMELFLTDHIAMVEAQIEANKTREQSQFRYEVE